MFCGKRSLLCVGLMAMAFASVSGHTIVKREALTESSLDEGVSSTPTPPVASATVPGVKESAPYETVVFEDSQSIPVDSNEIGPRYIEEIEVKASIIGSFGPLTEDKTGSLENPQGLVDGGVFVVQTQEENEVFKGGEELKSEKSTMDEGAEKMKGDLKVKENYEEPVVDVVEEEHLGNEISSKEKAKEGEGNSKDEVKVPLEDKVKLIVLQESVDKVPVEQSLEDATKLKVLQDVVDVVQLQEDENIKIEATESIANIGHNESETQVVGFPNETQVEEQGQGQQEQQQKETLELSAEPRNNEEQEQLPQLASSSEQQVNLQLPAEEQNVELFADKITQQKADGNKEIVTNGALNQAEEDLLGNEAVVETTVEPIELLINSGQEALNADEETIKATTTTTARPWYSNLWPGLPNFPSLLETSPVSATTDVAGDGGSATTSSPGNGLFGFGLLVVPWNLGNLLANPFNFTAFPGLPLLGTTGQQQEQPEAEDPLPQGRHGLIKQLLNATAPNYSTAAGGPIKAWKQLHNKTSVDTFFKSLFMPLKYALHYHSKPQQPQQDEQHAGEVVQEVRHQGLGTIVNQQQQQSKLLVPTENAAAPSQPVEETSDGAAHLVAPSSILLEVEISNPIYNLWRHFYNGYAPPPADNAVATQG